MSLRKMLKLIFWVFSQVMAYEFLLDYWNFSPHYLCVLCLYGMFRLLRDLCELGGVWHVWRTWEHPVAFHAQQRVTRL